MNGEVWRVVPSFPQFLVSSEGRIMVAPYLADMPSGGTRQYGGQPTFGVWNKQDGRFIIVHKGKTYKVASLICEAFSGPKPVPEYVCMHDDENAANNRPDNLKWGTQKENLNAPAFVAYCQERTGEDSPWVKGRIARENQEAPGTSETPPAPVPEKSPEQVVMEEQYVRIAKAIKFIGASGTLANLQDLWVNEQRTIKSLPDNWQAELTKEKDAIKAKLQPKEQAA